MSRHLSAGTWCLWMKKMVLVPWIWPSTPCASLPNSLAEECIHTLRYFGWVINCWYFNSFPVSSSKTSNACSVVVNGLLSNTACANSIMLSCGLGGAHLLQTILAKAWAYLDQVVGPLLGTVANGFATINFLVAVVAGGLLATLLIGMVASGLSIVAVATLGDNIVLGDCCMSPALLPTLGSGMGS